MTSPRENLFLQRDIQRLDARSPDTQNVLGLDGRPNPVEKVRDLELGLDIVEGDVVEKLTCVEFVCPLIDEIVELPAPRKERAIPDVNGCMQIDGRLNRELVRIGRPVEAVFVRDRVWGRYVDFGIRFVRCAG